MPWVDYSTDKQQCPVVRLRVTTGRELANGGLLELQLELFSVPCNEHIESLADCVAMATNLRPTGNVQVVLDHELHWSARGFDGRPPRFSLCLRSRHHWRCGLSPSLLHWLVSHDPHPFFLPLQREGVQVRLYYCIKLAKLSI